MKLLISKSSALLFLCASFFLPGDRAWAQQAGQPGNMGGRMQGGQGTAPRGRLRKLIMLRRMKRRAASGMGGARTGSP